jgi:hypothetical protein
MYFFWYMKKNHHFPRRALGYNGGTGGFGFPGVGFELRYRWRLFLQSLDIILGSGIASP